LSLMLHIGLHNNQNFSWATQNFRLGRGLNIAALDAGAAFLPTQRNAAATRTALSVQIKNSIVGSNHERNFIVKCEGASLV